MGYGWPMLKSTFTGRRLTAVGLIPFHLAFIVVGTIIAVYTVLLTKSMSEFRGKIIAAFGYVGIVYMYSTSVFTVLVHAFGVKLCMTMLDWKILYRHKFTWQIVYYIYLYFMMFDLVNLIGFAIYSLLLFSRIQKAFQNGIKAAMLQYRSSVEMKEIVDHNQFRYQCCGAINYRDWYKIAWTEKHYLDLGNTALVQQINEKGGVYISDNVPFSCCKTSALEYCNTSSSGTINNLGCVERISSNLYDTTLLGLGVMALILSFAEVILIGIFRLLQTANDIAISWGDPTQLSVSYWWNTGPPPFPPNHSKTNQFQFAVRKSRLDSMAYQYSDVIEISKMKREQRRKKRVVTLYKKVPPGYKQKHMYLNEKEKKKDDQRRKNLTKNASNSNRNDSTSSMVNSVWKLTPITLDRRRVDYEHLLMRLVRRGVIAPDVGIS